MLTSNLTVKDADGVEWTYSQTEDQDSSGFWYPEHWAEKSDGTSIFCDWSRFSDFQKHHFEIFVKAGFPKRRTIAPWSPDQIDALGLKMDAAG